MTETPDARVKRLHMRSMRRGIKEMDLILSAFAGAHLAQMSDAMLTLYDALLAENDHDIYGWVNGQFAVPAPYADLVAQIAAGAHGVTRPA
ncbi:succinate dehydrogenase assembly factor 2 [Yoonia sp.]|jgi:antitoxin CptB|uniref:succinate dehydrogenase assembly factor 2 n=1 Tax=Yoonia sp. TaxID=2212373 RepID=UPI0025F69F38|nr:succinate dehydrogenase assembly factor 2 [Yoonia sp.]